MHYLIDGHNLIGKMPDIDLRDPDDEIKLILRLKSWLSESKKREATVIFDGGQVGGVAHRLSSRHLTVVFSPPGEIADTLIIRRLQKLKNAGQYIVVSSDRMVLGAAQSRRIKAVRSEEFIEQEGFVFALPEDEPDAEPLLPEPQSPKEDPQLTDTELSEWLDLFGPVVERPLPPPKPRRSGSKPAPPSKPAVKRTGKAFQQLAESENPELNEAEVTEWLDLFGPPSAQTAKPDPVKPAAKSAKKKKRPFNESLTTTKNVKRKLSEDEVDAWLDIFGREGD